MSRGDEFNVPVFPWVPYFVCKHPFSLFERQLQAVFFSRFGINFAHNFAFGVAFVPIINFLREGKLVVVRKERTFVQRELRSCRGCAVGYYGYLWAEVLDTDAFDAFEKNGIFDAQTAQAFRSNILEKGDSQDPMKLYRQFRGADPNPESLLRNRGLISETTK